MIKIQRYKSTLVIAILATAVSSCSSMSEQDKATAIGAGAGAIGASILTGGSTAGTIGGAAVGGYIGHEIKK